MEARTVVTGNLPKTSDEFIFADSKSQFVQLHLEFNKNSFIWIFESSFGQRYLFKNPLIDNSFYDDFPDRLNLVILNSRIENRINISPIFSITSKAYASLIPSPEYLLNTDRLRVGGFQNLRGFYENEFFSDRHLILTHDFNWEFQGKIGLKTFFDTGWISNNKDAKFVLGWGGGIQLVSEKENSLQLMLGMGKRPQIPLNFSETLLLLRYETKF